MKKAYYVDTYSHGILHEMFDASSLKMFASIYDEVEYFADITAKEHLVKMLGRMPDNVIYHKIGVPGGNWKIIRFWKQIKAMYNNCYYIIKASVDTTVIINYNTMSAIYLINWITKLAKKKVLVICHGEMQALCIKQNTSFLFKANKKFFTSDKTVIAEKLYFAVLGDIIKKNLRLYISKQIYDKMLCFDHTAIFDTIELPDNVKSETVLNVGVIGIIRESKGLSKVLELANNLKKYQDKIKISVVGKVSCDKQKLQESGIYINEEFGNRFLSRMEMYRLISQLDIILFLYPKDGYKVTASGSLFDAIDCERPILALRNDYLEYFSSKFGSVGNLVDTYDRLEKEIVELLNGKKYSVDFKLIKRLLAPDNIAVSLKKQLDYIEL